MLPFNNPCLAANFFFGMYRYLFYFGEFSYETSNRYKNGQKSGWPIRIFIYSDTYLIIFSDRIEYGEPILCIHIKYRSICQYIIWHYIFNCQAGTYQCWEIIWFVDYGIPGSFQSSKWYERVGYGLSVVRRTSQRKRRMVTNALGQFECQSGTG